MNVGPMIEFMRQNAMTAPMSGQKVNVPPFHSSAKDNVGGRAKRRFESVLGRIGQSFHLIEAASADYPDCCVRHGETLRVG
jgi:hypothetical protein